MTMQVIMTIIVATLEAFLYLGSVFGWSSLQPILINEGFFADGCFLNETTANISSESTNETAEESSMHLPN